MTRRALSHRPMAPDSGSAQSRAVRRFSIESLVVDQHGVVHRRQLYASGITRWQVEAELRAGRWMRLGSQTLAVLPGGVSEEGHWWRAVLEVGPTAVLAGATALRAAGLRGISSDLIHVAAPKSARPRRAAGVRLHETRRLWPGCSTDVGLPRMRPATAVVFAALWAVSNRQAALFLVASVQQRLTTGDEIREALDHMRRHPRRRLLLALIADVTAGAESLGELDFAKLCRARGLPEPTRQRVVRLPSGRVYLDVCWDEYGLVVEIDGIQHLDAVALVPDALRQNDVTLDGRTVLRIPVFALRSEPDPFLDQVEVALLNAGWPGPRAVRPTNGGL